MQEILDKFRYEEEDVSQLFEIDEIKFEEMFIVPPSLAIHLDLGVLESKLTNPQLGVFTCCIRDSQFEIKNLFL